VADVSQYLFPFASAHPAIKISVSRTPLFSTKVFEAISGAEQRISWRSGPRYRYVLDFDFLRDSYNEIQALLAFVEYHRGRFDSFVYLDPYTGTWVRVRFDDDATEVVRLLGGIWQVKKLAMISILNAPVGTPVDFTTLPTSTPAGSGGGLPFILG
jgi:hypothetical protein